MPAVRGRSRVNHPGGPVCRLASQADVASASTPGGRRRKRIPCGRLVSEGRPGSYPEDAFDAPCRIGRGVFACASVPTARPHRARPRTSAGGLHVRRATAGGTRGVDEGQHRVPAAVSPPQGARQAGARCRAWRAPGRRHHARPDEAREAGREGPPHAILRPHASLLPGSARAARRPDRLAWAAPASSSTGVARAHRVDARRRRARSARCPDNCRFAAQTAPERDI